MDDLSRKRRAAGLVLVVRGDAEVALATVRAVPGIAKATREEKSQRGGDTHELRCSWQKKLDDAGTASAIEQAVAALVAAGCFVREVRPVRSSLEEVFAELTSGVEPQPPEAEVEPEAAS